MSYSIDQIEKAGYTIVLSCPYGSPSFYDYQMIFGRLRDENYQQYSAFRINDELDQWIVCYKGSIGSYECLPLLP